MILHVIIANDFSSFTSVNYYAIQNTLGIKVAKPSQKHVVHNVQISILATKRCDIR